MVIKDRNMKERYYCVFECKFKTFYHVNNLLVSELPRLL